MKKDQVDALNNCISDAVDRQKEQDGGVTTIICSDINQKSITPLLTDHPDIIVLNTPSTRKEEVLDVCLTNISQSCSVKKLPPLQNETGQGSDHACMFVQAKTDRVHSFEKTSFKYRPFSEQKADDFASDLAMVDWTD